jgi:hypothetical protein
MNDPELDLIAFETGARTPTPRPAQPTTWAEALVNLKAAAARGDAGARKALVALGEA